VRRTWRLAVVAVGGALLAAVLALTVYSSFELARFARGEHERATYVYAAGQPLVPGVNVEAVDLAGTLARLKYTEVRASPSVPGQFRRTRGAWEIHFRRSDTDGERAAQVVRLDLNGARVARVSRGGRDIGAFVVEPEVLTSIGDRPGEAFRPLRLADAPLVLLHAVLAAEDHRFFEHAGIDVHSLLRAAWTNLRAGRVRQGGSTLTQQLVKNRLLTPKRTWLRKLEEAWLAALVEWRYPKPQILEAYLNEIYLGQRGPVAVRGVSAATRAYFGKEVHQLTLGEAALLAGMIRAPNNYSPAINPERARDRRNVVLARMHELGRITDAELEAARHEPVRTPPMSAMAQPAPYFSDYVRLELEQRFGNAGIGGRVQTTLDPALQRFAEASVARGLDRLESGYPRLRRSEAAARLQAALVALDPASGAIRALVGGRDYALSQFNRAALARRQAGSAFKPFVYLAALRSLGGKRPALTAATVVDDSPITLTVNGEPWTPRNYEDRFEGPVTVRRALELSLNAATIRVAQTVGLPAVVDTARTLGLAGDLHPFPALALGAFEVTPVDLARAYVPLADNGVRPPGIFTVHAVREADGRTVDPDDDDPQPVITPAEAYLMTSLLQGVINAGTGAAARNLGVSGEVAGKTGTTNDGRDAWFVGYSSRLLAVVWVGFDGADAHGLSGGQAALPIWADFMRRALDAYPAPAFVVPDGITFADIDTSNGKRANQFCPTVARETFLAGTEPPPCDEHGGMVDQVGEWWRRFTDWFRR
jgi:penicillin-binding protein 1B